MDNHLSVFREMISLRGLTDHTLTSYCTYIRFYLDYLSRILHKSPEEVSWEELRGFIRWLQNYQRPEIQGPSLPDVLLRPAHRRSPAFSCRMSSGKFPGISKTANPKKWGSISPSARTAAIHSSTIIPAATVTAPTARP